MNLKKAMQIIEQYESLTNETIDQSKIKLGDLEAILENMLTAIKAIENIYAIAGI